MNVANLLLRASRIAPRSAAVRIGTKTVLDYASLGSRAGSIAAHLAGSLRVAKGDRVILLMTNCAEYIECLFGCWLAGAVCVPVNAKLHEKEIAFIIESCGAKAGFVTANLAGTLAQGVAISGVADFAAVEIGSAEFRRMGNLDPLAIQSADADDPAWLFYTSGTTGRPKGATLTHRNLMAMTLNYFTDIDAPARSDSILHAAPMSHGSGLYILPHVAAMAGEIIPESDRFDPAEVLDLFQRMRGISLFAAPTMVKRLVAAASQGGEWPGLRTLIYGGGPMYVEDCKEALQAFGPRLVQIYGQGESPMTISVLPKHLHVATDGEDIDQRLASVGYPQSVVEVRISAREGQVAALGEAGEIMVRGDTVMRGYWGDTAATRQTIVKGWLATGDIGSFDGSGLLTLKDRSKDVIISGGSNIYPREVEEVLLRHPAVAEVAVLGRNSQEWGEEVVAFIVMHGSQHVHNSELDALCDSHIARFKRPKAYFFSRQLPKNNYGKIVKAELRAELQRRGEAPGTIDPEIAPE